MSYDVWSSADIFPLTRHFISQVMTIIQFVIHKTDHRMSANVPKYEDNNEAALRRAESHESTCGGTEKLALFSRLHHSLRFIEIPTESKFENSALG